MPGQVDFYVRPEASPDALETFACRLVETVWRRGHRVLLLAASEAAARRLDDLLWTFRDESFVPHRRVGAGDPTATEPVGEPVVVSTPGAWSGGLDVLVNLTPSVPEEAERAARIVEIVPAGDGARAAGRERYRDYRSRGFELRTHR